MQWVRRTVLKPDNCVSIDSDYTRLSEDCMTPQGQVLVIRANRSQDVLDLVASEPLSVHKGICCRLSESACTALMYRVYSDQAMATVRTRRA